MLEHLNQTTAQPNRVVVMGAGGFVGSAVTRALSRHGVHVLPLTRRKVDLLAPNAADALAALLRPDDTLVAASALAPVRSPAMLRDNISLVEALSGALARQPVAHVVNIGSDAVYSDSDNPLREDSCRSPESLHGLMHLTREVMLADVCVRGSIPLATVRPTLIYGADDPHNGYGPNRFRRLAARGEPIVLFGQGEERRDHVWVEDVADIVTRVISRRSRGALNAATGEVISFMEVARAVARPFDSPPPIQSAPRQGPMPHGGYRAFDPTATRTAFPDFAYTPPLAGFSRVHAEMMASVN